MYNSQHFLYLILKSYKYDLLIDIRLSYCNCDITSKNLLKIS